MKFAGLDVSLNHGAVVVLDESGSLVSYRYLTETKKTAAADPKGTCIKLPPTKEFSTPSHRDMFRLSAGFRLYRRWFSELAMDYAYAEDYAYGKHGGEMIGELAGMVKLSLWGRGVPFRLMGPGSVKMFAAHNGAAEKDEVIHAVRVRWGSSWDHIEDMTTVEDLADAFTLARMCWTEWAIRGGRLALADLEHEKERQVFLRTTKAQPVNVLGSEWVEPAALPAKVRDGA